MKESVEFLDRDFLDNKIELGDKVIFEAPKYRDFVIGTVISKAQKSCQIEYVNDWNYPGQGHKDVVRQCYGQLIKYPITKEGILVQISHYSLRNIMMYHIIRYLFQLVVFQRLP